MLQQLGHPQTKSEKSRNQGGYSVVLDGTVGPWTDLWILIARYRACILRPCLDLPISITIIDAMATTASTLKSTRPRSSSAPFSIPRMINDLATPTSTSTINSHTRTLARFARSHTLRKSHPSTTLCSVYAPFERSSSYDGSTMKTSLPYWISSNLLPTMVSQRCI